VGAKVNGRMVPLRHKLHSGDIVEILTQPGHKPSRDWLSAVKSSRARNKIKHWLNLHQRERAIEIGRKLIEKEARKYRVALKEIRDEELRKVASDYGLGQTDDLMAGIGYGKYSARQVLARLSPAASEPLAETAERPPGGIASVVRRVFGGDDSNAIRVKGQGDLLVYRARCCNPIRGEAVVGYVTRGKGVAVHSLSCPNVVNLMYEPERRIDVEWGHDEEAPSSYPVKLTVYCDDRFGMLKQITAVISDTKTNIRNIEARTSNGQANVDVVLDIADLKHLEHIITGVRRIPGVREVQRLQKV
jgi:GTP pyrophosphokinase